MSRENQDLREISREGWTSGMLGATVENLRLGALLRIADAQEKQVAHLNCIQNQIAGLTREVKKLRAKPRAQKKVGLVKRARKALGL